MTSSWIYVIEQGFFSVILKDGSKHIALNVIFHNMVLYEIWLFMLLLGLVYKRYV